MTPLTMTNIKASHLRIAFIGGGNMAAAIIGGLLKQHVQADHVLAIDPLPSARERLSSDYSVRVASEINQGENFLQTADLIVLAVKPAHLKEVLLQLQSILDPHDIKPILSIVAGVKIHDIANILGHQKIVRAMPNTPALISEGITGLFPGEAINKHHHQLVEWVCHAIGDAIWVENESLLDAVTAISGSGPAYVFALLEHLQTAGQKLGLSAEQAKLLAAKTFVGAGLLALKSEDSPAELREKVTSKGGTTFAALEVLKNKSWGEIMQEAVLAANHRAQEMGNEFSKN